MRSILVIGSFIFCSIREHQHEFILPLACSSSANRANFSLIRVGGALVFKVSKCVCGVLVLVKVLRKFVAYSFPPSNSTDTDYVASSPVDPTSRTLVRSVRPCVFVCFLISAYLHAAFARPNRVIKYRCPPSTASYVHAFVSLLFI